VTRHDHPFADQPAGRDLDRVLAFVDDECTEAEAAQLLADLDPAERAALEAMRLDARALRAMPAPHAPEALHEAIMSGLERAELFAPIGRVAAAHPAADSESQGVLARPWALRWRSAIGAAAVVGMLVTAGWLAWPRPNPRTTPFVEGPVAVVPATFAPTPAPYALVLEFDDFDDAEAALRSAVQDSPATVTCVCSGHCTAMVEGPPHVVGEGDSQAEITAVANCPTHRVTVSACELPRVLGALVGGGEGAIETRHIGAERWSVPAGGMVELPVFIRPASNR